jgi:hypothetical protein
MFDPVAKTAVLRYNILIYSAYAAKEQPYRMIKPLALKLSATGHCTSEERPLQAMT